MGSGSAVQQLHVAYRQRNAAALRGTPSPLRHTARRFPELCRQVGLRITLFEACSTFTHVTARNARGVAQGALYTEDFGCFVASTTAPIATGWSDSCGAGISSR